MKSQEQLISLIYDKRLGFEEKALSLFEHQFSKVPVYRKFCESLNKTPENTDSLYQIPHLPISFFKTHEVFDKTIPHEVIYESSGTGGASSKHLVHDESFYLEHSTNLFESDYYSIQGTTVLGLMPSYLERKGSSLVSMTQHFIERSQNDLSGFFLDDHQELFERIELACSLNQKVLLLGVTFGLLDFAESFQFSNPQNITVMETGGMKGRRKEIIRSEVHEILTGKLGVKTIHSEYGMTELLSQSYSKGKGTFKMNDYLKIWTREINDPFARIANGLTGGINFIDLANFNSCSFVATSDMGKCEADTFEILGRMDHSDMRGCNLMVS